MPLTSCRLFVCVALLLSLGACAKKPTMRLDHAEISGVRIAFPPSLAVQMTVVVNVDNTNGYDVAVRAVRGQVVMAEKYTLPVDFRAPGEGVWLAANQTTQMRVPIAVPVDLGLQLLREGLTTPAIPFRFAGKADVTATRTFQIEKDDYSVDEKGEISRQQLESALRMGF